MHYSRKGQDSSESPGVVTETKLGDEVKWITQALKTRVSLAGRKW